MGWMSARRIAVLGTLSALVGCSLFVSTSGLDDVDAPDASQPSDANPQSDATDVIDPAVSDGGVDAIVDADADAGPGILWPTNGHRYEVRVFGSNMTWTQARNDALASGGHLVTITSAAEQSFVLSLVNARSDAFAGGRGPWIGAYQPNPTANDGGDEPAGGWAWVTGEAWSYEGWSPGEPNNVGGGENWAAIHEDGNGWIDIGHDAAGTIWSALIEYE